MLTVEQALEIVLAHVPKSQVVNTSLREAVGRVLVEDCLSDLDMPPFDKAMMDGYAVRSGDTGALRIIEEIPAGKVPSKPVLPGTCAKIMTGAPVPAGADAVQQVEKTIREGDKVTLQSPVKPGQNIAPRATDMRQGEVLLRAGHRIRPCDIGALAASGNSWVTATRKPTCAVVATGDELVPPSKKPGAGQIRNSNTASICAQVEAMGLECEDLGIVPDDTEAIRAAIRKGLKRDLLILSGGVSAGSWDLVIPALLLEGIEIKMHQVLIKPGRPFCFAPRVFGLPGNPVSSFVIFEVFVRPYLGKLMGADVSRPRVRARLESDLTQKIERVHYLPARVRVEGSGYVAETVPWQGSADLFALTKANAFVVVPVQTTYARGDTVECMMLDCG
jgi:molybdopterin molybdotransferase